MRSGEKKLVAGAKRSTGCMEADKVLEIAAEVVVVDTVMCEEENLEADALSDREPASGENIGHVLGSFRS